MIGILIMILSVTIPAGLLFMCFSLKEGDEIKEAVKFGGFMLLLLTISSLVIVAAVESFQYGLSILQ